MEIRALLILPSTALALLAPLVASAATPLGAEQVTSISKFSDLRPTD